MLQPWSCEYDWMMRFLKVICCFWGQCPVEFSNMSEPPEKAQRLMTSSSAGRQGVVLGVSVVGLWSNTHTYKTCTRSFTNTHFLWEGRDALLLPVVAELDGGAVKDAAEGDWLHLPVRHRVAEQADARVHGLLGVEARRTEVLCSHGSNLVSMEVDHLRRGFE